MDEDFFLQNLMDNYQNPKNVGKLKDFSFFAHFKNPTCGDSFDIFLKIDNNNKIIDVKFEGDGCAISTASMSIFSETIKQKKIGEILKYTPKNIYSLLGIKINPARINCALVSLNSFNLAISNKNK